MDRAERAIGIWQMKGYKRIFWKLGVSKEERKTMRKVMRETDGDGGPWFYQYAIKKGLID